MRSFSWDSPGEQRLRTSETAEVPRESDPINSIAYFLHEGNRFGDEYGDGNQGEVGFIGFLNEFAFATFPLSEALESDGHSQPDSASASCRKSCSR